MHNDHTTALRVRGDRGAIRLPSWFADPIFRARALDLCFTGWPVVLSLLFVAYFVALLTGHSIRPWWVALAVWIVLGSIGVGLLWARRAAKERADATLVRQLPLEEWLASPPVLYWPEAWRVASKSGLSVEEAQAWSDRGVPFVTAASARLGGITPERVGSIADALRAGGMWDGRDRGFYDDCVTQWVPCLEPSPNVLERWLAFTPAEITAAASARAALDDVALITRPGASRTWACIEVLEVLEDPTTWPVICDRAKNSARLHYLSL